MHKNMKNRRRIKEEFAAGRGNAVCYECHAPMRPEEYRALHNEKEQCNDVICPKCFKKHTGSENYEMYMFNKTWVVDGVTYPR